MLAFMPFQYVSNYAEPCLARFYAFSIFFYYAGVMPSLALLVFMSFQSVSVKTKKRLAAFLKNGVSELVRLCTLLRQKLR